MLELAHGINGFFWGKFRRLLTTATSRDQPLLVAYMSDGWASDVFNQSVHVDKNSGVAFRRAYQVRKEWCLQRAILKTIDGFQHVAGAMVFSEPIPMEHGRGASQFFAAFTEFLPPIREKTLGLVAQCFSFDGALFSPLMHMKIK